MCKQALFLQFLVILKEFTFSPLKINQHRFYFGSEFSSAYRAFNYPCMLYIGIASGQKKTHATFKYCPKSQPLPCNQMNKTKTRPTKHPCNSHQPEMFLETENVVQVIERDVWRCLINYTDYIDNCSKIGVSQRCYKTTGGG